MIQVYRKGQSKKDWNPDTTQVSIVTFDDQVELRFQTAGGRGMSDISIAISSDSRKLLIEELLTSLTSTNGKSQDLTDYTKEELVDALQAKFLADKGSR